MWLVCVHGSSRMQDIGAGFGSAACRTLYLTASIVPTRPLLRRARVTVRTVPPLRTSRCCRTSSSSSERTKTALQLQSRRLERTVASVDRCRAAINQKTPSATCMLMLTCGITVPALCRAWVQVDLPKLYNP